MKARVRQEPPIKISEEVQEALRGGAAVVALESSLIAQGLPAPQNLETAVAAEAAVRDEGAVPATTAVEAGRLIVGAGADLLERLAESPTRARKAASRDLGPLIASRGFASTTVSATIRIAHAAGIDLVATGGIGGVHRGAEGTFDVSSDIEELASTPVAVVSSGAKAILDLPATLELLETRRVPVIGIGVEKVPAFYATTSGLAVSHTVAGPADAAAVIASHLSLPGAGGILLVQPPPSDLALDPSEVERWIASALAQAGATGVRGAAVTPFLLARLAEISGGATLRTNIGLIVNNARMAARVAARMAAARVQR